MINPKTIKSILKALKTISEHGPHIIYTAEKIRRVVNNWRKDLSESKLLEEGNFQTTQEYEQTIDVCIKSLRQHVKVINRNSMALKEHAKIIEDITAQSEDLAIVLNAVSRWITVLAWTTGISFVIAIVAVLIAIFK